MVIYPLIHWTVHANKAHHNYWGKHDLKLSHTSKLRIKSRVRGPKGHLARKQCFMYMSSVHFFEKYKASTKSLLPYCYFFPLFGSDTLFSSCCIRNKTIAVGQAQSQKQTSIRPSHNQDLNTKMSQGFQTSLTRSHIRSSSIRLSYRSLWRIQCTTKVSCFVTLTYVFWISHQDVFLVK